MNHGQDETVKENEPLHYPASLAPSKELLEASKNRQYYAYGYDREDDLYFAIPYKGNQRLTELGRKVYFVHKKHFCLNAKELFQMAIEMTDGEDAYIFHELSNQLYYLSNQYLEKINLLNPNIFLEKLKTLWGHHEYDYNFLTFAQINDLITAESGHKPTILNDSSLAKTTVKRASLLLNDLFPPKVKNLDVFNEEELHLDKLFL